MKIYAGFWQRVNAFMFDYLFILLYITLATIILLLIALLFRIDQWLFDNRTTAQVFSFFMITFPVMLYFGLTESSAKQATRGKHRHGLRVVGRDGNRIGPWRAFARTVFKLIPWEISHTLIWNIRFSQGSFSTITTYGFVLVYLLVGLNLASVLLTKTKQSLYDLLAGTYVVQ